MGNNGFRVSSKWLSCHAVNALRQCVSWLLPTYCIKFPDMSLRSSCNYQNILVIHPKFQLWVYLESMLVLNLYQLVYFSSIYPYRFLWQACQDLFVSSDIFFFFLFLFMIHNLVLAASSQEDRPMSQGNHYIQKLAECFKGRTFLDPWREIIQSSWTGGCSQPQGCKHSDIVEGAVS